MTPEALAKKMAAALDGMKALDIQILDVRSLTTMTDFMIIASGRSDRHVKSLAQNILETARDEGVPTQGVEGQEQGEWILIDLGDVIMHIMHPSTRAYYQLEKLWSDKPATGIRATR